MESSSTNKCLAVASTASAVRLHSSLLHYTQHTNHSWASLFQRVVSVEDKTMKLWILCMHIRHSESYGTNSTAVFKRLRDWGIWGYYKEIDIARFPWRLKPYHLRKFQEF